MRRPAALLALASTLALAAAPAASAQEPTPPAGARTAALALQHALGAGRTAGVCRLAAPRAVRLMATQLRRPTSTPCARLVPGYRAFVARTFGVKAGQLRRATYLKGVQEGGGWAVGTTAGATVVVRSGGAWKATVLLAVG